MNNGSITIQPRQCLDVNKGSITVQPRRCLHMNNDSINIQPRQYLEQQQQQQQQQLNVNSGSINQSFVCFNYCIIKAVSWCEQWLNYNLKSLLDCALRSSKEHARFRTLTHFWVTSVFSTNRRTRVGTGLRGVEEGEGVHFRWRTISRNNSYQESHKIKCKIVFYKHENVRRAHKSLWLGKRGQNFESH